MQFQLAHPSCPLCKRQLPVAPTGNTLSTRLCEQCQSLVVTALRGPIPVVAAPPVIIDPGDATTPQIDTAAQTADQVFANAPVFSDALSTVSALPSSESQQTAAFGDHDEMFNFFEDQDPDSTVCDRGPEWAATSDDELRSQTDQTPDVHWSSMNETQPSLDFVQTDGSCLTTLPWNVNTAVHDSFPLDLSVKDDHNEQPVIDLSVSGSSMEGPLSSWDYSKNEWPVFVVPAGQQTVMSRRTGFVGAIVLALAAVGYFLMFQPSNPDRSTTGPVTAARAAVAGEPHAAVGGASDSNKPRQQSLPVVQQASSLATQTVALPAAISSDSTNGQARFSLQAAAFPNADGADEFANKLKNAGVPSYVVTTDLARRGRWFRVRVGKFDTADEAQRYAGEALRRARAAGLALQLIVCQYDQP